MKKKSKKKYLFATCFSLLLIGFDAFVLLKAFVLPEAGVVVVAETATDSTTTDTATTDGTSTTTASSETAAEITATSYSDDNIQITITDQEVDDTVVHIVDIKVSDPSYLKTAFAQNTYGRNIKATTSEIAADNDAILAINGDYYGFRSTGYVIRNGVLYRDNATSGQEDLVIDSEGNFSIIDEADVTAQELLDSGAQQVLSFGPALISDGQVVVDSSTEVDQSMQSNPRTAIGQIDTNHYVMIVSEGRTDDSVGLTLYQLAQVFESLGATTAYNLDGGGSSTLYFNGQVINETVGGRGESERSVSDIVYIGK